MDPVATWLVTGAGSGAVLVSLAAGVLYVTREAIATAVQQAGAREIERLRGELAGQLEKERQAFTRELERERQAANRDLEKFKTDLASEAEVRRQVATQRVGSLMRMAAGAKALIDCVYGSLKADHNDRDAAMRAFWNVYRENLLMLESSTRAAVEALGIEASRAVGALVAAKQGGPEPNYRDLQSGSEAVRNRLFDELRLQLGLPPVDAKKLDQ